jgi:hypothetical protein
MTDPDFSSLPRFDARNFEPPAWASSSRFAWGQDKHGESSTKGRTQTASSSTQPSAGADEEDDDADEPEIWEDASEGRSVVDLQETIFTTEEIKVASISRFHPE